MVVMNFLICFWLLPLLGLLDDIFVIEMLTGNWATYLGLLF